MSPSEKFTDHREAKRHPLIESLDVFDHSTNEVLGHLADISLHGIKLISNEQLPTGKEFKLKMTVPTNIIKKGSIRFTAKSIWIGTDQSPKHFAIGFKTTSLSDKNRKLLTKLIQSAKSGEGVIQ